MLVDGKREVKMPVIANRRKSVDAINVLVRLNKNKAVSFRVSVVLVAFVNC